MKMKLFFGMAVLVVGLLACGSSASAALTYFDAQILDITEAQKSGNIIHPANTVICDPSDTSGCTPISFTASPNPDPGGAGDNGGNWTQNIGQPARGQDGLWNQRFTGTGTPSFGNQEARSSAEVNGNDTVYESRGNSGGPNPENLPTLRTTINVNPADVGQERGVYALFWDVGGPSQISACVYCDNSNNDQMPLYTGQGVDTPSGYVFDVYDVTGIPNPDDSPPSVEMNGFTSTDAAGQGGNNRRLNAAWLGNVVLGSTLSVLVGDGPPLTAEQLMANGGANYRTWYDGIAYGDVQDLQVLPFVPEPTSAVLVAFALTAFGIWRRRG